MHSIKAALLHPGQSDEGSKPALAEFEPILAASQAGQPATHEQSEQLLQQFMQWREKPGSAETRNSGNDNQTGGEYKMPDQGRYGLGAALRRRWTAALFGALLAGTAAQRAGSSQAGNADVVRDLAGRVGPIVGSALACRDIARPRIQVIVDKFAAVIREASSNEAERDDLTRLLDRYVADGRGAVTSGKIDCRMAERQLADLEQSIAHRHRASTGLRWRTPSRRPPPPRPPPAAGAAGPVRGITDREIRFGIAAPFSGPARNSAAR